MKYEGRYAERSDHYHVLAQLPPVGGPERAHELFRSAVEDWRPSRAGRELGGLVLLGPTGDGKTTALRHLALILLAKLEAATSMMFVLASDLADSRELAERAKTVRFLFLDDMGRERDPYNRIFQVLDYRHNRAPTFISSGLQLSDLEQHYDGATMRRMFEFRGVKVRCVHTFVRSPQPLQVKPPREQNELARRLGERL